MSEKKFIQQDRKNKSMAAKAVERIQSSGSLLSSSEKHLAEIHPIITSFVEFDTKNEDFGRINDVDMAKAMAQRQVEIQGELSTEKAFYNVLAEAGVNNPTTHEALVKESNDQLDRELSSSLYEDARNNNELATAQEAAEIARKVVTDYQITQANPEAISRRSLDIVNDVARQGLGQRGAIKALNDVYRTAQEETLNGSR